MNWIFIGILAGSLVTSTHDNQESCEGRAVMLRGKGVVGKCETHELLHGHACQSLKF